jgi:SAM-dependent methyltransferase
VRRWLRWAGERWRPLVPQSWRAWRSICTDDQGRRVPARIRPLVPCTICGGTRFRHCPKPRLLSFSGRLGWCANCRSLERHRAFRKILTAVGRKQFGRARCLQFSGDKSIRPSWFGQFELSIYGKENSLDIQQIARADASYDVIICNHVVEHVPAHRKALRELGRILSDRGFLFLSVPDPARRTQTEDWGQPDPMRNHHYREFGPDFADLLKQELPDLSIVEVRASDDVTGDPDIAYILTRNAAWYRRALATPFQSRVHATRPFAPNSTH